MTTRKKTQTTDPVESKLDEVVRLLALNVKRERPLSDAIEELSEAGFAQARIAELLGTSPAYVNVAISRAKMKPRSTPRSKGLIVAAGKNHVEPGSIDELVRIVVLFLKYQGAPQGAVVHDLTATGLEPARIAELIGTTANSVSQQKRKRRPKWPAK